MLLKAAAAIVALAAGAAAALVLASAGNRTVQVATAPSTEAGQAPTTALDLRGVDLDLDAERVTCVASEAPDARRFDIYASATPNTGAITSDAIVRACQTDLERIEGATGLRPHGSEICRDPAVAYPQPIQLLGGGSCADRGLIEITSDDLEVLNEARQAEAALLLATEAASRCPTATDVVSIVRHVLEEHGQSLAVEVADSRIEACYRPTVSWVDQTVVVAPTG